MNAAWRSFALEIARWRDSGRTVEFWWRDDDATGPDARLGRLLGLAAQAGTPLALAVIPAGADAALAAELPANADVLQHGVDHLNRAAGGEKKTEFPAAESAEEALARLVAGGARLRALFGTRALAVLAPPWNRLAPALVPRLAEAGLLGLTAYGVRASPRPAPGVRQLNTHVDIIDWHGTRGFVGESEALGSAERHLAARRSGLADSGEATGWLTHHACHDEAAWSFLARLLETTRETPGVRWLAAREYFTNPAVR